MAGTITRSVTLYDEDCISCGVMFAMTADFIASRKRDHNWFYCPNGHGMSYPSKSDAEIAREQRDRAQAETARVRAALAAEAKAHSATKGVATRLKNRAKAGMCTDCRRTFANYAEHMRKQHAA